MVQPVAAHVPYMTLPGNHETTPFDLPFVPYMHRFVMPWSADPDAVLQPLMRDSAAAFEADGQAQLPGKLYYSFDVSTAHIAMLNTEVPDVFIDAEQLQWLEHDLEAYVQSTARVGAVAVVMM
jgi:hypothetical protein